MPVSLTRAAGPRTTETFVAFLSGETKQQNQDCQAICCGGVSLALEFVLARFHETHQQRALPRY
jgi:hypothetical protein